MSNHQIELVDTRSVNDIKALISKPKLTVKDTSQIIQSLNTKPTLLNHLSLEEISKLSVIGIDLSQYMSAVHMNNIKVFVVKFASDSMMRVSKLINLLNKIEDRYYNSTLNNQYIHPKVAADMITQIQESITASVNLMMKLTDNEPLMNLFMVNMTSINDSISENKTKYESSMQILPLESRKKIDRIITLMTTAMADVPDVPSVQGAIDAEYTET